MTDIFSALATRQQTPNQQYFQKLLDEGMNTAPIGSHWQGASRLAHSLLAGWMLGQQNSQDQDAQALRMKLPGLEAPADTTTPTAAPANAPPLVNALAGSSAASAPTKIYDQNERNPLDLPAGQDRDMLIRAIHAEAGNQGPEGMRAVASVVRNRAANGGFGGDTVPGVLQAPNQFEPMNTPQGQQRMASLPAGSNQYNAISKTVDEAYGGDDPSNGATNFFAPKAQASLGRPVPAWAQGPGQDIGDHRFFGSPQTAQATLPSNAMPTQGGPVPMAQPQAAQPTGATPYQRAPFQIEPGMAAQIKTMLASPDKAIQQQGMQLYTDERKKMLDQTRSLTDPKERLAKGIQATDTNPYQIDAHGKVTAVNPQPFAVNVNQQGESKFAQAYGEGKAADALGLERSADKTMQERQQLQVFKSLVQDFKTGKLAPAQMTVGAWGDALGLDPKTLEKIGVPANAAVNGQLIESLSNQMTLGMIGTKGGEGGTMPANNFSDADRKFLQNTVPGLARVQGGNMVLAEIKQRGLDRNLEKVQMWDDYRSQGKSYETFERDWRQKVRGAPSIFADIPDMVKGLSGQQNESGWAPPGGGANTTKSGIKWSVQ